MNLLQTDLLVATAEGDMPGNTICGKRGRCYNDLQTQQQFVTDNAIK